jgi:hypothetical protein
MHSSASNEAAQQLHKIDRNLARKAACGIETTELISTLKAVNPAPTFKGQDDWVHGCH